MDKNTYFIADTHIGYGSRRTVAVRGFGCNWERHEQAVLEGINRVIDRRKVLYILGDVGSADDYDHLKKFLGKINTRRIILLLGNHDDEKNFKRLKEEHVIIDYDKLIHEKCHRTHFTLCHYPIFEWEGFFKNGIHLYGHCHNNVELGWKSMDVGIDNIGYTPISVDEVMAQLSKYDNIDEYDKKLILDKRY